MRFILAIWLLLTPLLLSAQPPLNSDNVVRDDAPLVVTDLGDIDSGALLKLLDIEKTPINFGVFCCTQMDFFQQAYPHASTD